MKKDKFAMISVTFILGAAFGISLFAVLSFVRPDNPPSPNQDLTVIDTTEAKHYFANYYLSAGPLPAPFKGFLVDKLQLEAMNNLVNYDRSITGFRLYMGKTDRGESVGIVVGVNDKFKDTGFGRVYKTTSANSGPCPYICDEISPITNTHN